MEWSKLEGKTIEKVSVEIIFDSETLTLFFTDGTKAEISSMAYGGSVLDLDFL